MVGDHSSAPALVMALPHSPTACYASCRLVPASPPFRKYSRCASGHSLLLQLLIFVTHFAKTPHRGVFTRSPVKSHGTLAGSLFRRYAPYVHCRDHRSLRELPALLPPFVKTLPRSVFAHSPSRGSQTKSTFVRRRIFVCIIHFHYSSFIFHLLQADFE